MRLFLDSNIMTYIAVFEEYMIEATQDAQQSAIEDWIALQGDVPDERLLHEVEALRLLYLVDERAHFDWLFSDVAAAEIMKIRSALKRRWHFDLLERLVEHRHDIYAEEGTVIAQEELIGLLSRLFPGLPGRMRDDALQFCEALLVEADYFLTNDVDFANVAASASAHTTALRASELPFVAPHLPDPK